MSGWRKRRNISFVPIFLTHAFERNILTQCFSPSYDNIFSVRLSKCVLHQQYDFHTNFQSNVVNILCVGPSGAFANKAENWKHIPARQCSVIDLPGPRRTTRELKRRRLSTCHHLQAFNTKKSDGTDKTPMTLISSFFLGALHTT